MRLMWVVRGGLLEFNKQKFVQSIFSLQTGCARKNIAINGKFLSEDPGSRYEDGPNRYVRNKATISAQTNSSRKARNSRRRANPNLNRAAIGADSVTRSIKSIRSRILG
jgi:hypothetical protein